MLSDVFLVYIGKIPFIVMIIPIVLCSILSLAVIIERLIFYKNIKTNYRQLFKKVKYSISKKDYKEAEILCDEVNSPISNIIKKFISNRNDEPEVVVEEEATSAAKSLEKHLGIISTIATVAPMLGLLGTVTGMMESFSALANSGPGAHDMLASGIGKALITTAFGLFVAIPSLIFYNYMVSKVENYIKDVDYIANGLIEILEVKDEKTKL